MPTYNYKCNNCGHQFSVFQKMSDNPVKDCSQCQGTVSRVISGGSGMIFRGEGFYLTDYGKSGVLMKEDSKATTIKTKEGSE